MIKLGIAIYYIQVIICKAMGGGGGGGGGAQAPEFHARYATDVDKLTELISIKN